MPLCIYTRLFIQSSTLDILLQILGDCTLDAVLARLKRNKLLWEKNLELLAYNLCHFRYYSATVLLADLLPNQFLLQRLTC